MWMISLMNLLLIGQQGELMSPDVKKKIQHVSWPWPCTAVLPQIGACPGAGWRWDMDRSPPGGIRQTDSSHQKEYQSGIVWRSHALHDACSHVSLSVLRESTLRPTPQKCTPNVLKKCPVHLHKSHASYWLNLPVRLDEHQVHIKGHQLKNE